MEGFIPFLYRAIVQYKNGEQQPGWFCDSHTAAYTRLPCDSGRFGASEHIGQILRSEYNFSVSASLSSSSGNNMNPCDSNNTAATAQVIVASGFQSPVCRVTTPHGRMTGKKNATANIISISEGQPRESVNGF